MTLELAGRQMGKAIAERMEFDMWLWALQPPYDTCISCGKHYKRHGWMTRHYRITGHWKEATQP